MLKTVEYKADFCVVGGGMAGICAAVAAARRGVNVVLMNDRPMLGGNASSEIRMWVCGAQGDNVAETGIPEEIFMENLRANPYKLYPVFDGILWELVKKEKNITLLMNCTCMQAETDGGRIKNVTGWQMTTQTFCKVIAQNFADCSGDSILAPLTGAEYRVGREAADEFGENVGAKKADKKTMGNSCLIQAHKGTKSVTFTAPSFAKKLTEADVRYRCPHMDSAYENFWYLELGGEQDTIGDAERIRDELIALAFGMWDYIKNSGRFSDAALWQLDFIGFLPGKRESRRMVGKVMVTQNDIISDRAFPDVAAYGGWPLDDHDPAGFYYDGHPNTSYDTPACYAIPYRALYSANVENLFFAGRNISMTHAAMSSARVMATCALCGQAVGTAAAVTKKYGCTPDGVYENHLDELQENLLWDDCMLPHHPRVPAALTKNAALTVNGKKDEKAECLRDGNDRENVYECEPFDVIEYRFASPVPVEEVRIIFDSDLNRQTLPGDRCERTHMTRCNLLPDSPVMHLPATLCKAFRVEAEVNGQTKVLAESKDNARRRVTVKCNEKEVAALKLIMTEANCGGEKMRLFSFEAK